MDFAQTLLKMATRAFYDTRQIIAVDAVMTHSWFVSRRLLPSRVCLPSSSR
ncbi:hypothetical protein IMZ48_39925 [Candidatus Bathyarchaeota archaeon]|nr:hypothetical protein [Candidatus Bathyarchaeota archaeon]